MDITKTNNTVKVCDIGKKKIETEGTGDDAKVYISGYANTKNAPDAYGDIPTNYNNRPVYDLSILRSNPVCFVDHHMSASNIAGNFVDLREDDHGLWFRLLLRPLGQVYNDRLKDAISSYINGFGRALSIGGQFLYEDKSNPSHLTTARIMEISIVGVGADPQALSSVGYPKALLDYALVVGGDDAKTVTPWGRLPKKFADQDRRWDSRAAVNRWRKASGSSDEPSKTYKNNFLWYDSQNQQNYGAYKLPIGDIIDGDHVAVPKAVFAARAAMAGARGGVDIPDSDRAGVERNIGKYYVAMGLDNPYKKSVDSDRSTWSTQEITSMAKGDLAYVLRYGELSRNAANHIASLVCAADVADGTRVEAEAKQQEKQVDDYGDIITSLNDLTTKLLEVK